MKISIAAVCLVSGLLIVGVNSQANAQEMHQQKQGGAESMHDHQSMHEHWKDPVAATQERLADLKQKLNLKPGQQAAWETFSNAMTARAKTHMETMQSKKQMGGMHDRDDDNMSTPERMEKMAAMMRVNADNFSKMAADTKAFYNVLGAEQKTIFDLFSKLEWNSRMQEHMHRGGMS